MKVITNEKARQIASEWHNGQFSALYSFCSTGGFYVGLEDEYIKEINNCKPETKSDEKRLLQLKRFFEYQKGKFV